MSMGPSSRPVALVSDDVPRFISSLRDSHASASMIVCSTPEDFVHGLLQWIRRDDEASWDHAAIKDRLEPTIQLIAQARSVKLAFCPSVQHLRAYLSGYTSSQDPPNTSIGDAEFRQEGPRSILGLLNAISLHRASGDYSAQAIGRTLATAVEAATSQRLQLRIFESAPDMENGLDAAPRHNVWDEQIPILNRSVRALATGDGAWMDSTVTVRSIVARWCLFEKFEAGSAVVAA